MDFTYILAIPIAAAVGIAVQALLQVTRRTARYGLWATVGVALLVNVTVLENWGRLGRASAQTLALTLGVDALLLPIATFVGVMLGVLPYLVLVGFIQAVLRRVRRKRGEHLVG